jgi:hypothetical protein
MSTPRSARAVIAAVLLASSSGCDGLEEIFASLGDAQTTVWTSDDDRSAIDVLVDGTVVGRLTAYRSVAPTCGTESPGAVTVTRPAGSYIVTAREVSNSGVWQPTTMTVSAGECRMLELLP